MEMQQMMEFLLARIDANTKSNQEMMDASLKEIKEDIKSNQKKEVANRKADRSSKGYDTCQARRFAGKVGNRLRREEG
jgi:hypothetical protein